MSILLTLLGVLFVAAIIGVARCAWLVITDDYMDWGEKILFAVLCSIGILALLVVIIFFGALIGSL